VHRADIFAIAQLPCYIMALWRITCIPKRRWNTTGIAAEIPTEFCSLINTSKYTHCEFCTGGEVCYLRLPC